MYGAHAQVALQSRYSFLKNIPNGCIGQLSRQRRYEKKFERADAIICISNNIRNDFLDIYPDRELRVQVVYHGVDHTTGPAEGRAIKNLPVRCDVRGSDFRVGETIFNYDSKAKMLLRMGDVGTITNL